MQSDKPQQSQADDGESAGTAAEAGAPDDGVHAPVKTAGTRDPEIVVSATRIATPRSQVGSAITLIDRPAIEQRQDRLLTHTLETVPGLDVRSSGGLGAQTSIFTRGTDSDHTLLTLDGIKLHDVASPNGTPAIDHLTTINLGQVEVLRGPQSTLYGSEAIGGVIAAATRRGQGPVSYTFSAEFGSYHTAIERFEASGGDDRFNFSIGYMRTDSDRFSLGSADAENDPYRANALSSRFGVDFTDEAGVDFFLHYWDNSIEIDTGANIDVSETDSRQVAGKIEPWLLLLDGFWEQRLGISTSTIDRETRGVNSPFFPQFPTDFEGRIIEIDWRNHLHFSDRDILTLGIDYESQWADFNSPAGQFDADTGDVGFYAQYQFAVGDRLFNTIGGRVDRHEQFGAEPTWRVASAYHHLETATIVRGSVGTAFKAPTLAELFDASFGSNNPNLSPEKSLGFDVGLEQSLWQDCVTVGATYFYNRIDEMIVSVLVDPVNFVFQSTNVEAVETQGIEFFLNTKLHPSVETRLSYTYTDTKALEPATFGLTNNARLLRRPQHKINTEIVWHWLPEKSTLSFGAMYVGERDDLHPTTFNVVTADDYLVLSVRGTYRVNDQLELFARVENVLDEEYQDVLGFDMPRVQAYGGFKFTF